MMNKGIWLSGAVATALTLIGATNAFAIGPTYGATFSGTASGVDTLGLFGAKGASLNNASYSQMFLINTQVGTQRYGSNQQDQDAYSSGFITATLTIDGKTVTVSSSVYGEAFVNDGGNVSSSSTGIKWTAGYGGGNAYHAVYDATAGSTSMGGSDIGVLSAWANNPSASFSGFPTTLDQSFTTSVNANGTTGAGAFSIYTNCGDQLETLTLHETIAAAPEPEAWALMLAGVAFVGAALRSRRRSLATA